MAESEHMEALEKRPWTTQPQSQFVLYLRMP